MHKINRRTFCSSLTASAFIKATSAASALSGAEDSLRPSAGVSSARGPLPLPTGVSGLRECVIDLGGTWLFSDAVPSDFRRANLDRLRWTRVQMPNELVMLGLAVKPDVEYVLRRSFRIPIEASGKSLFIRFDSVYSYARIWVNGHYVRDHHGGFTSWDCDITPYVGAGERADLVVVLVDRTDDPSGASTYAMHSVAGILRDVRLVAVPPVHITHLQLCASLDDHYSTGLLDVSIELSEQSRTVAATASLSLRDPMGKDVPIRAVAAQAGTRLTFEQTRIPGVHRWDSEHPMLYELVVDLRSGTDREVLKKAIGFRKIERVGNRLLVNGDHIILRGASRMDIHPTLGRTRVQRNDEYDPVLLKRANFNFIRTAIAPPTEAFLDACDRVGVYLEEETAVTFLNYEQASDPALTTRFISQFAEMLARDHWRPSVILWSLGNESAWGANFVQELELVREVDPSRPVFFSWTEKMGLDSRLVDIYSSHYPMWNGNLGSDDFPVLHDEMAHVACYNTDDLRRDPGVRNFWGKSIAIFAERFMETPGCVGGAIWAAIDEVFLLPDQIVGYGPWGIIDGWRREKPEFWLTRKAFSPIRMEDGILPQPQSGTDPVVSMGNGYNHTNLESLKIEWSVGERRGVMQCSNIEPHCFSRVRIPTGPVDRGEILKLVFTSADGSEVDRFELPIGERITPQFSSSSGPLKIESNDASVVISGEHFLLSIDRKTGLISSGSVNGRKIIEGGPLLNLGHGRPDSWSLAKFAVREQSSSVAIVVSGESVHSDKKLDLQFELEVFGDGRLDVRYVLMGKREIKIDQLGLTFVLPASIDRLAWHRRAQWSVYPADHIGRPSGTAYRTARSTGRAARDAPELRWAEDIHEPFLDGYKAPAGKATNDFRSLKEHVFWAGCFEGQVNEHLRVESQGQVAVRASPHARGQVDFSIYNFWRYPELSWGNYCGPELSSEFATRLPSEYKLSLRLADHPPLPLLLTQSAKT